MHRERTIIGNWKAFLTIPQAEALTRHLVAGMPAFPDGMQVVLAPSFEALTEIKEEITTTPLKLGAQDLFWEDQGSFTGEVSGRALAALGIEYVLVGHSERRQFGYETDGIVNKKLVAALRNNLTPVFLFGETRIERDEGKTEEVITRQVAGGLSGMESDELLSKIIYAYEPVWAVGGKAANDVAATEAIARLTRELLFEKAKKEFAYTFIYGGSVDTTNAASIARSSLIHGAVVGRASVDPAAFISIVQAFLSSA
ncbi:MAG: triosephosphate isomerase [Parcubacteria group bacterium]|nr:triosephosphate isomerase [Parcubacteria group bacterium]